MTTTVYDGAKRVVACDSRWSIPGEFGVLFVDEAPFYKAGLYGDKVFLFAGKAPIIDSWKKFLSLREDGVYGPEPSLEGIAVLVAEVGSGRLVDYYQQDIVWPSQEETISVFAGTGSTYAANCWQHNRCPQRAVETAKNFDICTGGTVRFLDLASGIRNWSNCQGAASLDEAFLEKGMVMLNRNDQDKGLLTFKEAAAMDPRVAELYNMAANASICSEVQAPCDAIYNNASNEEKQRFRESIVEMLR